MTTTLIAIAIYILSGNAALLLTLLYEYWAYHGLWRVKMRGAPITLLWFVLLWPLGVANYIYSEIVDYRS